MSDPLSAETIDRLVAVVHVYTQQLNTVNQLLERYNIFLTLYSDLSVMHV